MDVVACHVDYEGAPSALHWKAWAHTAPTMAAPLVVWDLRRVLAAAWGSPKGVKGSSGTRQGLGSEASISRSYGATTSSSRRARSSKRASRAGRCRHTFDAYRWCTQCGGRAFVRVEPSEAHAEEAGAREFLARELVEARRR